MKTEYKPVMRLAECPVELREAFLDTELEYDYWVEDTNNMDFYMCNKSRLRWKFAQLSEWGVNREYYKDLFGESESEGFKVLAKYYDDWETLSKLSLREMTQIVEDNKLDWLGDDFEDISDYIHMVECFSDGLVFRQTWTQDFKDSCLRVEKLDHYTINNFKHRLTVRPDDC